MSLVSAARKTDMNLSRKSFSHQDQKQFAQWSGDCNPMHMDAVYARRTQMGGPVVHGINAVLWALDALCSKEQLCIAHIRANFASPIYVGATAEVSLARRTDAEIRLQVFVEQTLAVTIIVGLGDAIDAGLSVNTADIRPQDWPPHPLVLDIVQLAEQFGAFGLPKSGANEPVFPCLIRCISGERVDAILALSRLVGMICPGLHSIFHGLSITFTQNSEAGVLRYVVKEVDDRFRLLRVAVSGGGICGEVTALSRMPPVEQPAIAEIAKRVAHDAYANMVVLVVGGSRGLGEVTAKICAAGGAHVIITYHLGIEDAKSIAGEIRAHGGVCDLLAFDVCGDVAGQLSQLSITPTHVCYFATGHISGRPGKFFNREIFDKFVSYYVLGFLRTCDALIDKGKGPLHAFYPSSVFVDEAPKGLAEYAAAKAAGEVLCNSMNQNLKKIRVHVSRLPKLLTDQTATTTATVMPNVLDVLLRIIQEFHAAR